jgi:hypothetical protein
VRPISWPGTAIAPISSYLALHDSRYLPTRV